MPRKINYQLVFTAVVFLTVAAIIGYSAWGINNSVTALSASGVQPIAKNLMTSQAKLEIVAGLLRRRQYGQWPLAAVPLSEDRGNPFAPNK